MPSPGPGPSGPGLPLDALLPPTVRYATVDVDAAVPALLPGESACVQRAVPRRREEFARGRTAARAALAALGVPPVPIPVGSHREPIWPEGVVGSISHCADLAWAAVASTDDLATLGIDVEHAQPLPEDVRLRVLARDEAREIEKATGSDTAGFGAKECVHKAIHPLTGVWLDFHDVRVVPDPEPGRLRAEPIEAALPDEVRRLLEALEIRWAAHEGLIFTSAWALPG